MNALISIKPKYVEEIINKNKKYEYRKSIFKKDIDKVYIYSTRPNKQIVGYFKYSGYLNGAPEEIWKITKDFSGIDEISYYKYFNNKKCAYAIKIEELHIFKEPIDPKRKINKFVAPQSYIYLEGDIES
ncbi:hypothetical protein ACHM17_08180 [Clostridium perfringens]|uniref:hypothetical protein n=1 Tax=Clostridium perfringens TaxID=1502 RepID=UPI0013E3FB22|nr:hypothetical protein [Clostridium perfringens]MBI6024309.1 hypothetical protein [Clostridium perfringens]MBI6045604.1 hypothetical protein [Clostridium perfringens]MBI6048347.1 hypothetical protein [Clostridium perfringens]MCX0391754.1 hypothetical protein [Clostridium perfringens]MDJ8927509.1 hypothetical protein [Clostridium perfringens]